MTRLFWHQTFFGTTFFRHDFFRHDLFRHDLFWHDFFLARLFFGTTLFYSCTTQYDRSPLSAEQSQKPTWWIQGIGNVVCCSFRLVHVESFFMCTGPWLQRDTVMIRFSARGAYLLLVPQGRTLIRNRALIRDRALIYFLRNRQMCETKL